MRPLVAVLALLALVGGFVALTVAMFDDEPDRAGLLAAGSAIVLGAWVLVLLAVWPS